jgi:hypothetical protein
MKGKISGLGMILLLVVMAVVLYLVAQAWEQFAPAAMDVTPAARAIRGEDRDPEDDREGRLPDIHDMRRTTDDHTQDVQDALRQIDGAQDGSN